MGQLRIDFANPDRVVSTPCFNHELTSPYIVIKPYSTYICGILYTFLDKIWGKEKCSGKKAVSAVFYNKKRNN